MALSPTDLTNIRAWSTDDFLLAQRTFRRAHPDPGGAVADLSPARVIELRLLDIMGTRLNAQLAVTPLLPAGQDTLAGSLATWTGKAAFGTEWLTHTPPPVASQNFYVGDIIESLDAPRLPCCIVTASLPGGIDVETGGLGSVSQESFTGHVYYVVAYDMSKERQLEALAGACAIANLLRTYRQDAQGNWQDGKIGQISRNVPRFESGPRFIAGIVPFSCTAYLNFTPTRA